MTRSTFSGSVKTSGNLNALTLSRQFWRSCGWGSLSVTWPDDSLQQRHPASQKLKVCLQVVEHLQANVLSESSDRGGTVCDWGGNTSLSPGAVLPTVSTPCPSSEVSVGVWSAHTHTRTHTPSTTTFDPCLKLTLPQASYSPWIPIIVSRIKTLSAKIFSASLIWCIPSPCEDRYSRQGKEHKPKKLLAKMQVILLLCFSQYSSAVRRLKQSTCLPSTLKHIPVFFIFFLSLYLPHSLAMLLHEVRLLPCRAGRHQHAHYRPASRRRHNTAGFTLSQGFSCHLHSLSSPGECFVCFSTAAFILNAAGHKKVIRRHLTEWSRRRFTLKSNLFVFLREKATASWVIPSG